MIQHALSASLGIIAFLGTAEITMETGVPLGWVIGIAMFIGGGIWAIAAIWFPMRESVRSLGTIVTQLSVRMDAIEAREHVRDSQIAEARTPHVDGADLVRVSQAAFQGARKAMSQAISLPEAGA